MSLNGEQRRIMDVWRQTRELQIIAMAGTGKSFVVRHAVNELIDRKTAEGIRDETAIFVLCYKGNNVEAFRALADRGVWVGTMDSFLGLKLGSKIPNTPFEAIRRRYTRHNRYVESWLGGAKYNFPNRIEAHYVIDEHTLIGRKRMALFHAQTSMMESEFKITKSKIVYLGDYTQGDPINDESPAPLLTKQRGVRTEVMIQQMRFTACCDHRTVASFLRNLIMPKTPAQWKDYNNRASKVRSILEFYAGNRRRTQRCLVVTRKRLEQATAKALNDVRPRITIVPSPVKGNKQHVDTEAPVIQTIIAPGRLGYFTTNATFQLLDPPPPTKRRKTDAGSDDVATMRVWNGGTGIVRSWPQQSRVSRVLASKIQGLGSVDSGEVPYVAIEVNNQLLMVHAVVSGKSWVFPFRDAAAMTIAKAQGETITEPYAVHMTGARNDSFVKLLYVAITRGTKLEDVVFPHGFDVDKVLELHKLALIDPTRPVTEHQKAIVAQLLREQATHRAVNPAPPPFGT